MKGFLPSAFIVVDYGTMTSTVQRSQTNKARQNNMATGFVLKEIQNGGREN